MKKLLLTALITLMLPGTAYAYWDMYQDPAVEQTPEQKELENIQQFFFEPPMSSEVKTKEKIRDYDSGMAEFGGEEIRSRGTPLFKQMRIKIQNYYRTKAHEEMLEQKRLEAEFLKKLEEEEDYTSEDAIEEMQEENLQNFLDQMNKENKQKKEKKKFNFFKRDKSDSAADTSENKPEDNKNPKDNTGKTEAAVPAENKPAETPANDETMKIKGGVKQVEAEKEAILDCEVVNYLDEEVEALGRPVLRFPTQGVKIVADRITYNTATNVLKAFDNVEVTKDGNTMYGDFFQLNINEENVLMTNLKADQLNMTIYAEKANAEDDLIVLEKGKIASERNYILHLQTRFMRVRIDKMVIPEAAQSHLDDMIGHTKVKVIAKNIKVNAKDDHETITVKDGSVNLGDTKAFNFKSFTVHTNKEHNFVETNIPEFGSRSMIGMFAGPGFVFDAPFGSTIKVMPLVNYRDEWGIGGGLRYTSSTNRTDMMYGSAKDVLAIRGKQYLDDKFMLQYGMNSYMSDWWMGYRMAKYLAEAVYMDGVRYPDFLGKGKHLTFKHRASFGYMHDSDRNRYDEKINSNQIGTTRLKYMAQIMQSLYSYHNNEKRLHMDAGFLMQGSGAIYGTGDTQFVGRIGPYLHTQYKYWMQDIGYFQSAYSDQSPIPRYDAYRYGKSNVYLREALRVNKYLTLAYGTSINLSDDAPNQKDMQESSFIVAVGPDDFKVSFGYDFVREQTYFTIQLALDTKGSSVEYDRLEIQHPEKLGQSKKYVQPVVFPEDLPKRPVKRTFAQVINIEDPNKEQI